MALITWNDGMSMKIREIDVQHQKLIKLINDLNDAMQLGQGQAALGKIVAELTNYTVMHFSMEEKLLEKHGYPDIAGHKHEHKKFINEVSAFKKGFDGGKIGLSVKVMGFLSTWLREHIMGTDKKYASFLHNKGVA